jgi:hypothetical protein
MKTLLKKTLILIGAPLIFIKISTAQNSQPLPEFSRIKADDLVHVELILADRHSAYNESGKEMNLKVVNGTLIVGSSGINDRIKIYAQNIRSIMLDGAAVLECKDTLRSEDLSIEMDGAAKADVIVASTNVKIDIDGAAKLGISGYTDNLVAEADGAAKLTAKNLAAKNVTVETDGTASATVHADSTFNAKSDGMSHVSFSGNPASKTLSVDGLSNIKALNSGEVYDEKAVTEASPDDNANDTTRIKLGNRKLLIIDDEKEAKKKTDSRRRMKSVYAGFEMGVNGFTNPSMDMNFKDPYKFMNTRLGNSWFFGLNLFEVNGHIVKNKLALTTGLGMQWSNYRFDGDTYLTPNIDSLGGTASPVALKSNKLYTFDLNAPFLIKFAPGTKNKSKGGFHIAAGVIVRYVTTMRVTTESTANGYKQRTKFDDDFNINPFRVDATVRFGYDKVKLFVNYGLTPYFNSSKAPDIRTFAAGITVIGF